MGFDAVRIPIMKCSAIVSVLLVLTVAAATAFGQGKGVDKQNQKITDSSRGSGAGNNGTKQDTGTTGSGINFGKDKTKATVLLPNPYRFTARRDVLLKAVMDVMRERKLIVDDAASRPDEGIIVSQPYTFIKGAVVTQPELSRYADVQNSDARGWTRGRYTLTVEIQPIDGASANVSINAKVEGRTDGPTGAEWTTLQSTGTAEQEFLAALIENVTGSAAPTSRAPQVDLRFSAVVADTATKKVVISATPSSVIINANPKSTRN
jgi:hypothetical protein